MTLAKICKKFILATFFNKKAARGWAAQFLVAGEFSLFSPVPSQPQICP
jgi:hypothetical protein